MKSIVLVGTNFNIVYRDDSSKITNIKFSDKTSLLDYDIAIIGLNSKIIDEYYDYHSDELFNGYPLINEYASRSFMDDLIRRRDEINSLIGIGKNVYFVLGDDFSCFYNTYEKSISGTGKNAKTTMIVKEINIAKFLLCEDKIKFTNSEGKNIKIKQNTKLTNFFNKIKNLLYYKSYFKCKFYDPLITTSNDSNVVASLLKCGNSYKIIMPEMVKEDSYDKRHQQNYLEDVDYVLNSIRELDDSLNTVSEIPAWIKNYVLSNEKSDVNAIKKIDEQIEELTFQKTMFQSKIDDNFRYKKLLYATGNELEIAIRNLFSELGFGFLPTRLNRSDLNLTYKDKHFVCEIKGLTKSAGEKNSNQLQKWETEFYEDYEIHPKQILIVNSFRDKPLEERVEDTFPNQMLDYAIKKEQCLITTTQLLCFYLCWLENHNILDDVVDKIIKTNGIFTDFNNWEEYIEEIE